MSQYDEQKALEISQSISAIYDHANASVAEICAATALALRVALEAEPDKFMRAFYFQQIAKNLTQEFKKTLPAIELIRPNGN